MFTKVLIANRGEIALRVLRCLRSLDIPSVVVYHALDRRSPWVRMADEAIEIRGSSPAAAHLDIDQILRICVELGVDAVHPGYGFLAESAEFARRLAAGQLTFIGPTPEVIDLMGDKIASRQFVADLGFPVPPGVNLSADDAGVARAVEKLGYPVVVKASAGGGGKGMSIVEDAGDLQAAIRVASSEAATYFGDDRVYVERYFTNTRHIEVQVLGDGHDVVHFGERECSIQRRFQKVVEEAPSTAVSESKRRELVATAVGIANSAQYTGAGTIEFLYTEEGEYFFLEMNTRIQVEHPVTEAVYGVDLIAEQIRVAAGKRIALAQSDVKASGHAIECRICAEDPASDFMPETGRVLFLREPAGEGIRVDSSLYDRQDINTAFDPMLAKLIVHAQTRDEAIDRAIAALEEFVLLGVQTNISYLRNILRSANFRTGATDTGFIANNAAELVESTVESSAQHAVLAAAYLSDRHTKLTRDVTLPLYTAMGGWRN